MDCFRIGEPVASRTSPSNGTARVGNLSEGDAHLAQAPADPAALSLMHWSTEPARVDDVIAGVQNAIAAKAALEIAKGMIAVYGDRDR